MVFLLLLYLSSSWAFPSVIQSEERIIDGSDAKRYQFPYIVSIHNGSSHMCGGSIISPTWVISAGHCCFDEHGNPNDVDLLSVFAGLLNQNESHPDVQTSPVSKITVHPNYTVDYINYNYLDNDIALMKLTAPLSFTKAVQPIGLPRPNQEFFNKVWVVGWGFYKLPETLPVTLQCLEMMVMPNKECQDDRKQNDVVPSIPVLDAMICTRPLHSKTNSTACHGDSGGPLTQNGTLIGIVSFGDASCKRTGDVGANVFTRVSSYIDFIHAHVKDI